MSRKENNFIIGIDEAGRGPLAGPVVVAGVRMRGRDARRMLQGIRDSKKLTALQREKWFIRLTSHPSIEWSVARISPKIIDHINVYQAAQKGARHVYRKLAPEKDCYALLDGSLYLSADVSHQTIVRGDELMPIISAASIIAKVTRDRIMRMLHKKYPQYRFDLHKGYGTKLHRELIQKFGRCPLHRASFHFH